jgi:hypothetical protein
MNTNGNRKKTSAGMGTLAWGEITRGRLSRSDRIRQTLTYLGLRLNEVLGIGTIKPVAIDLADLAPPDSREAMRAAEVCREASSTALANHCLRSYFWGAIIARLEKRKYDPEVFFVAAMLHDMAITEKHAFCRPELDCFALEGAHMSLDEMSHWNWEPERRFQVAEAIALHVNVSVPARKHGTEAYLLQAATALDVGGIKQERIQHENRRAILERLPREGLSRELVSSLGKQAEARPHCRMAYLFANGFDVAVRTGDRRLTTGLRLAGGVA